MVHLLKNLFYSRCHGSTQCELQQDYRVNSLGSCLNSQDTRTLYVEYLCVGSKFHVPSIHEAQTAFMALVATVRNLARTETCHVRQKTFDRNICRPKRAPKCTLAIYFNHASIDCPLNCASKNTPTGPK